MLPAIFAVLLLGHFVAAEIYVGQNPQNVNAVIKDANGNLIPVTGVADEIVVVDLNYGGEENNTAGMSVDVSVSPINGSSSGSSMYPPSSEYPSSISSPSEAGEMSNPPLSASPVSLPSATAPWNPPTSSSSSLPPPSTPGSAGLGTGSAPSGIWNPSSTSAPSIPTNPSMGMGSSLSAPATSNLSTPPKASPPFGSKNKPSSQFLNPFGSLFGNRPKKQQNTGPFSFIELGGSLGPVDSTSNYTNVDAQNNTPSIAALPLTSTITGGPVNLTPLNNFSRPFNFGNVGTLPKWNEPWNLTPPTLNMSSLPMNFTNPFMSMNTNSSSITALLNSLFGNSTTKLRPLNTGSLPLTGLLNSFINSSPSLVNPRSSNMPSIANLMNSFMSSGSSLFSPSNFNTSLLSNLMNSFANSSSMFNSSSATGSLNDMMSSILNMTSSMFNLTSASGSPFANLLTLPSGESAENGELSSLNPTNMNSPMSSFMNSFLNTLNPTNMDASPVTNLMSSFFNGNSSLFNFTSPFTSGNTTGLKSMMQSFLPAGLLGDVDGEYDEGYPEDDFYQDLMTEPGVDDDEDYYNPLSSLLPPPISSNGPSSANGWSNLTAPGNLSASIGGIFNMVNNMLTPESNGSTPLTDMLDSLFGVNGNTSSFTSPFISGGLLNPASFMNSSKNFNLTSALANYTPFSSAVKILSSLNKTGLFGDLSGYMTVVQNMSSILTDARNNNTKNVNFGQVFNDLQSIWQNMSSTLQTFMKNVASKSPISVPQFPQPIPSSIPQPKPFVGGMGTSFLALPPTPPAAPAVDPTPVVNGGVSSSDNMQASAPAADTPSQSETTTPTPEPSSTTTSPQSNQNNSTDDGTSTPPPKGNGTNTSSSSGGINLSSTWITLIGCLFVAFSQKNFLGLI